MYSSGCSDSLLPLSLKSVEGLALLCSVSQICLYGLNFIFQSGVIHCCVVQKCDISSNLFALMLLCRDQYLFKQRHGEAPKDHKFYRILYPQIIQDIEVRTKINSREFSSHRSYRILR